MKKIKINKSKLSKALKQISIFVGKNIVNQNAALVHFFNKDKKAMIFATDFASAGRVYFDTEYDEEFEFCIDYNQFLQAKRIRSSEIEVEIINNDIIEFYDDKTKFTLSLHNVEELVNIEKSTVIPDIDFFEIEAKTFKEALKKAGYARNEKDTQNIYINGVNFTVSGDNVSMASTDRHRIAVWKNLQESFDMQDEKIITGVLSPKTIDSVNLFDDNEKIKIYIEESKIVIVSSSFEAYATKIQCTYPDINKFFTNDIISSYEVLSKDVLESLSIIEGVKTNSLRLEFMEDAIKITAQNIAGDNVVDYFSCKKITGNSEDIWVDPVLFMDVFKNVDSESIILEFREINNNFKILSYSTNDGAYGMLAPQRK